MKRQWRMYTRKLGRKLRHIYARNAWLLVILAVTDVILFVSGLRGYTALFLVALKESHVWIGFASIALLLMYLPFLRKHLTQLRERPWQLANLTIVLLLIAGWSVSGLILWLERSLPAALTSAALLAHDIL